MAWPFTPYATFVDHNTPLISAAFLNASQAATNAISLAGYGRVKYIAYAASSTVRFSISEPFLIKDATSSKYIGIDAQAETDSTTESLSFSSGWNYVYCKADNGVLSYGVTATAPESSLRYITGDETKRYLFSVYGSSPRRFNAKNGRYNWEETLYLTTPTIGGTGFTYGATSWQDLDLAAAKPLHASIIRAQATLASSTASQERLYLKSGIGDENPGDGDGYARAIWTMANDVSSDVAQLLTFYVPGNNKLRWQTTTAGNTCLVQVFADGFEE